MINILIFIIGCGAGTFAFSKGRIGIGVALISVGIISISPEWQPIRTAIFETLVQTPIIW
jgi:hypothetical protein